jgi:hypothetical protein
MCHTNDRHALYIVPIGLLLDGTWACMATNGYVRGYERLDDLAHYLRGRTYATDARIADTYTAVRTRLFRSHFPT